MKQTTPCALFVRQIKLKNWLQNQLLYDKLLNCIKESASYGDKQYPEVVRRFRRVGSVELKAVGATWHPKCHKDAVHADKYHRAKKRYEQQISSK